MFNKKGFTLVELLAVIVVLAIILSIAVPGISGIIKSATKGAFESDAKMVLQAIEYKKLENNSFDPREVTKENMVSTLGVSDENYQQINISTSNGIVEVEIIGQNKWNGLIAYGTIRNMNVVAMEDYEVVLPAITILGDNPLEIGVGTAYTDAGATAVDSVDGILPISSIVIKNEEDQVVESVDTSSIGTFTITYKAINSKGREGSSVRRVNVVDKAGPVITLLGNNQITINKGSIYTDAGVTALDDVDGDVTDNVVMTGIINPNVIGTYTITYNVSDEAGNEAAPVIRTINVVDVAAPVITILGNNPVTIYLGETYSDAGATALDGEDGDVTSSIVTTGSVNINAIGTYTITYTVNDATGNEAIATRTVNVVDIAVPAITFVPNGNVVYAKSRSATVTVSDNVAINSSSLKYQWSTGASTPIEDTFITSFSNGETINTPANVTGSYYLWILAKDTSGNMTIQRSNVFNLDNTIPIVTNIIASTSGITATTFTINRSGNASDANGGLAVSPYIYQISTDGTSWTTKCTNNTTTCNVTGVTENTLYYYHICVNDIAGNQVCTNSNTVIPVNNYFCGALSGDAQPANVLIGKTFYNQTGYKTGTMTDRGAAIYTPGASNQTISAGYYNGGGYVAGDADLIASNIKKGVNIFNVLGTNGFTNIEQGNVASLYATHCSSGGWGSTTIPLNFLPDIIVIRVETISVPSYGGNIYGDMYWSGKKAITTTQRAMFISDVTATGFKINVSSNCGADSYPCTWTDIDWVAIKL